MKNKRSTNRSFPGRLTLDEWLTLPAIGRRDMIRRAECELLDCARLCAEKMCRRHRTCSGDDAMACERRLRRHPRPWSAALLLELCRIEDLAQLRVADGPDIPPDNHAPRWPLWDAVARGSQPRSAPVLPPWEAIRSKLSGQGG